MNLKLRLISAAAIATCSMASHAAAVDSTKCTVGATPTAQQALDLVVNCAPAATVFIGGASTQQANLLTVANATLFDVTAMTPIEITTTIPGVKSFLGKTRAVASSGYAAGTLVYVINNVNNGSAGGVSQLLGKTPKVGETDVTKAIPEADVPFIGPAKNITTPGGTVANAFCTLGTATSVACTSHTTQTADMALSDVRAEELYALYPAAKGKVSTLTQVPLLLQSFGVAVSQPLYIALQKKSLKAADVDACIVSPGINTAACQPSISRADYASLVSEGGKINSLATLTGDSTLTDQLKLARRDDLSGTQASSNIFFVNGQCGGNDEALEAKSIDKAVAKAGGLLGGLAIRTNGVTADDTAALDVQAHATSTTAKAAIASSTDYAIGVLGTGDGAAISTYARFVKVDGMSPNFDGTNYMTQAATRAQIANGAYPFAYVMHGMYLTAMTDTAKKAAVVSLLNGFKSSALTDLKGLAYLDSAASGAVVAKQAKYSRVDTSGKVNNCSPLTKL